MDKALLDTDILSEVFKAKDATIVANAIAYREVFNQFTISVITVMEIVKGLHKMRRADALRQFLEGLHNSEVLPFDRACAEIAGRIFADLERIGRPIGRADPMIAAIAMHNNLTLVSGNQAHYQQIQGLGYPLRLDNWR
ncbi:MAG: type II toxin-antitoxin system VapC family toxin [Anaerolineales bacterium]|nr:type II toxin-antitoxin system VapC family toxin [Anaerolineales bacterium]